MCGVTGFRLESSAEAPGGSILVPESLIKAK
jgi:hypothetical protein